MIPRSCLVALGALGVALVAASDPSSPAAPPGALLAVAAALLVPVGAAGLLRTRPEQGRPRTRDTAIGGGAAGGTHAATSGAQTAGPSGRRRTWVPVLVGAAALAIRLAIGAAAEQHAGVVALPEGRGPWTATVESVGTPHDGGRQAVLSLDAPGTPRVAATLPRYPSVAPFDRVVVSGSLRPPPPDGYGDYLRRARLLGSLRASSLDREEASAGLAAGLEALRRASADGLARVLPEPEAGLAAGILVGLRDRVDRDLADAFTTAGVSHVVAISGWNIAIVAAAVAAVAGGLRRRRRALLTIVAVVAYTAFAGASPSVVRAAIMAAVVLLARESGRAGGATTALGWAVVLLLLADPRIVMDPGFQLSALATAGLIAWATPLTARLRRVGGLDVPAPLAEGLGISIAAQAATLPVVLVVFGRLSIVSPAVNLAIVPLVPASMAAGLVALLSGLAAGTGLPGALATVLALPAWLVLTVMVRIVEASSALPLASVTLEPPMTFVAAGVSVGILVSATVARGWCVARIVHPLEALIARSAGRSGRVDTRPGGGGSSVVAHSRRRAGGTPPRAGRHAAIALAVALLAVSLVGATRPDDRTHLTMLDVGQGDAILVEGGHGGRLLVDGGPDPERLLVELDERLPPWDRRLDLVVLTHPHEDHVAGLPLLLERYRVGRVFEPGMPGAGPGYRAFVDALARAGRRAERLRTGDRLTVDDIVLTVLWPDPTAVPTTPPDTGRGINDVSIVLLGEVAGRRFLLTGDAEDDVDPALLARGLAPVDVLKVAHHGSRTASSDALLRALAPMVALVSVGADNTYGHPSPATLARLEARGARVFRTDLDGAVEVTLERSGVTVSPERRRPERPRPTGPGASTSLLYHRDDVRAGPRRGRLPAPVAPPTDVVPAAFARRRRDRRLARAAGREAGWCDRSPARRGGRPPPRRRQAARSRRPGCRAPPRRRIGRLARAARARRTRAGDRDALDHEAARRGGRRSPDGRRRSRGAGRRLRGQARGPAPRVDGREVRRVGEPLPGGLRGRSRGLGHRRIPVGASAGGPTGGQRVRRRRDPPRRGSAPPLDRGRAAVCRVVGAAADREPRVVGAAGDGERRIVGAAADREPHRRPRPMSMPPSTAPVAFYWGDDVYGLERAATAFGERIGAGERLQRWRPVGDDATPARIAERVGTASFFGGGTLVLVSEPATLLRAKADREAMTALLAAVAPGNALVFIDAVDGSDRRSAATTPLREAVLAAGGEARECRAPRAGELAGWIDERARERSISLGPGAARALAERVGGFVREGDVDRRRQGQLAVAELEKLALYRLGAEVGPDDVRELVAEAVPASTWAFLDTVAERRGQQAAESLTRLAEATPPQVLVVHLHRRLRELIEVADRRAAGETDASLVRSMHLKPFRAETLARQARAWTLPELERALDGLLEIDVALKGADGRTVTDAQRRLAFLLWVADLVAVGGLRH